MTLVVAVPSTEGAILASDSQVTMGAVRVPGNKLFRLNDRCAWAGAGEVALIQRVAEAIGGLSVDQPLAALRDHLSNSIKQCISNLLQVDFRTQFFVNNPDGLLGLHPGDFVFVECNDDLRILHITANGTSEWIEGRAFAIGNGAPFAYALLRKYHGFPLGLDRAALLAYKVVEEAIDVGSYGLGGPIRIWEVRGGGTRVYEPSDLAALQDSATILRDLEIRALLEPSEEDVPERTSAEETRQVRRIEER